MCLVEKEIIWQGDSLEIVRGFPERVRFAIGTELRRLQTGLNPANWKPMKSVGRGVREIRVNIGGGFRVIYIAEHHGEIHVLHAFRKKTQRTSTHDIRLAAKRLKPINRREH